jgi:hypothetical protein
MKLILAPLIASAFFAQTATQPWRPYQHVQRRRLPPPSAPETGFISLAARDWAFTAAVGQVPSLTNNASGNLTFQFPVVTDFVPGTDPASVNYLETTRESSLRAGTSILITISIITTGSPVYNYATESDNTCVVDATARPIIDTGGPGQYDRWWPKPNPIAYKLSEGATATLAVPLTPDPWSSVYGEFGNANPQAEAGFSAALDNVTLIGLTFGGGCFFGHGVSVSNGTSELEILAFSVER